MRILIIGLPLFSERLYNELREFDTANSYYRLDTYYSKKDRLKALFLIPFVDIIYSINGTLSRSRSIDIGISLRKTVMMTWVGTDVLLAQKNENRNQKYIEKVNHFCEVNWIKDELKALNINADILNFAVFDKKYTPSIPDNDFTVLSYIPKVRSEFYGLASFKRLAISFPDVRFLIAGASKDELGELPVNIEALGWVKDMNTIFDEVHVCVRFPEHDGLSNFILESLARGKEVMYKYDFNHCHYCPDEATLSNELMDVYEKFKAGNLKVNSDGSEFIGEHFNRQQILGGLVDKFKQLNYRK